MCFRASVHHGVLMVLAALLVVVGGTSSPLQARSLPPDEAGSAATYPPAAAPPPTKRTPITFPLTFEPNLGQADPAAKFVARGRGYRVELQSDAALVRFGSGRAGSAALRMSLAGSDPHSHPVALDELALKTNYQIGNASWHTGVPNYAKVVYNEVYPGVDLVYYGNQGRLEYDLVVKPGADANRVRLVFHGAEKVRLDTGSGDLVIRAAAGPELRHGRPLVYQQIGRSTVPVAAAYRILPGGEVGFTLASYDHARALVIDPTVNFVQTMSGSLADYPADIAVDSAGNSFVTGITASFTQLDEAKDCSRNGNSLYPCPNAAFLAKYGPTGTLLYLTFFGGKGYTSPTAIALDNNLVYVVGSTNSTDLGHQASQTTGPLSIYGTRYVSPVTNAFVARFYALNPGQMLWATWWGGAQGGGSNEAKAVAIDHTTHAIYVGGVTHAADFPAWSYGGTAWQTHFGGGGSDGFVTKIDPAGLLYEGYSTFIGGSGNDDVRGIAVDSGGNAYVTGQTCSANFRVLNSNLSHGSLQRGGCTAFFVELSTNGNAAALSFLLGGSSIPNDAGNGITIDGSGSAYIVGETLSPDFPVTANAAQRTRPCANAANGYCKMAFVSKLAANGNLVYSTFFGGTTASGLSFTAGYRIAYASSGQIYVVGVTDSTQALPGVSPYFVARPPSTGFLTSINPAGGPVTWTMVYASEMTGVALGLGTGVGAAAYLSTGIWVTGYGYRSPASTSPPWSSIDLFVEKYTEPASVPVGHF